MAKKKGKKKKGGGGKFLGKIDFQRKLGKGGGIFAATQLPKVIPDSWNLNEWVLPGAMAFAPELLGKVKLPLDKKITDPALDAIETIGLMGLMQKGNVIEGMGALNDDDEIAVAFEGVDDEDISGIGRARRRKRRRMGEEVLGDDDIPVVNGSEEDDDIPTVNGDDDDDDDMGEEVLGEEDDVVY